jgi:hypothetical protein
MFGTMEGSARPHNMLGAGAEMVGQSEAELLRALQEAADNIMRLAAGLRLADAGERRAEDIVSIRAENAHAQQLIGCLLAKPVCRAAAA